MVVLLQKVQGASEPLLGGGLADVDGEGDLTSRQSGNEAQNEQLTLVRIAPGEQASEMLRLFVPQHLRLGTGRRRPQTFRNEIPGDGWSTRAIEVDGGVACNREEPAGERSFAGPVLREGVEGLEED